MIRLKSQKDIYYIKKAIQIGENILDRVAKCLVSGMSSNNLNTMIEDWISAHKAIPSFKGFNGFPTASCISVNNGIIHGIPNNIPLKNGDLIKIDIGINYKNYFSDQARTYFVGKIHFLDDFKLIKGTQLALKRAISVAKEGNYIGDISAEIEQTAKEFGLAILTDFGGHGVGFDVHEAPHVPNIVGVDKDIKLVKGLVLAIEPMLISGDSGEYTIAKNGFDIIASGRSAHFESTIIIE